MAESKELKSLLTKMKESEKVGLILNIQKTKIMASGPITPWQIDGETMETVRYFILGGSKVTADGDCSHEIKRCLLLGRKVMTNLVQFSCSVMSDSLWPLGLQHARLPCLSPTPGAYSNSCPLRRCCHLTISSSVIPFSSHLQPFPVSGPFWMSPLFASGSRTKYWSFSFSISPSN